MEEIALTQRFCNAGVKSGVEVAGNLFVVNIAGDGHAERMSCLMARVAAQFFNDFDARIPGHLYVQKDGFIWRGHSPPKGVAPVVSLVDDRAHALQHLLQHEAVGRAVICNEDAASQQRKGGLCSLSF